VRKNAGREGASVMVNELRRPAAEASTRVNMVEAIDPRVAMLLPMAEMPMSMTSLFRPCDETLAICQ
jgi:hypothetical protein